MYAAKRSGRSTHRLYDPAMRRAAEDRVAVSRALREALANDRLFLHYQPQVWTGNGILRGVEALARWTDPVLGEVPPARFIPIAEEYGLIGEIGEWSLREAVRQLARWRAAGVAVPKISVNLSPAQLQSRGLVRHGRADHCGIRRSTGRTHARDHRGRADEGSRRGRRNRPRDPFSRRPDFARRFRDRLFQSRPPRATADRRTQDRPQLHEPHRGRSRCARRRQYRRCRSARRCA